MEKEFLSQMHGTQDNGQSSDSSGSLTSSYVQLDMEHGLDVHSNDGTMKQFNEENLTVTQSPYDFPREDDFSFVSTQKGYTDGIMGQLNITHSNEGIGDSGSRLRGIGASYLEKQGFGWLFDTDDAEMEDRRPLLEELDIDLKDIFYKIRCVIFPCPVLGYNRLVLRDNPDFWGPLLIILIFSLLAVYGQFKVLSWIITIWIFGSFLIFLLARVLGGEVNYSQCLGIIGYSVLPLIITASTLPVLQGFILASVATKFLGVAWAAYSAGSLLCVDELQEKKPLLFYPVFLLYIYLLSLYTGA